MSRVWRIVFPGALVVALSGVWSQADEPGPSEPPGTNATVGVPTKAPDRLRRWQAAGVLNLASFFEPDQSDWLYLHPIYRETAAAGTERGGQRDEYRTQDRGRFLSQRGLDFGLRSATVGGGVRVASRGHNDYHYYGPGRDRWSSDNRFGETFAYLNWRPGSPGAGLAAPDVGTVTGTQAAPAGLAVLAGRAQHETDPEGLLFVGESAVGRLRSRVDFLSGGLNFTASAWRMEREERARGRAGTPSNVYLGSVGWSRATDSFEVLYAFFRAPGRAAEADLVLPGFPPTQVTVPTGQAARPDLDVHYYGARVFQEWHYVSYTAGAYVNHGREIAVDRAAVRQRLTRRTIDGSLLYAELVLHLNRDHESPPCARAGTARGLCVRASPLRRGPEVALAGLYASRDRNPSDTALRGFGALRPLPAVLGGAASILLTGPAPGGGASALRNTQPGAVFADVGVPTNPTASATRPRDNADPALPDYGNEGLNLGGLRLSFVPLDALTVDVYANYAGFPGGAGTEAIASVRYPIAFADLNLALQFSATGATLRPNEWERQAWTGLLQRPARRYYSRYLVGFVLVL